MSKERRFKIELCRYDDFISNGEKVERVDLTDKKLIITSMESTQVQSISELRKINNICSQVEPCEGVLLLTPEHREYIMKRIEATQWNAKKEFRRAVLALFAKLEMAEEVEVEVEVSKS